MLEIRERVESLHGSSLRLRLPFEQRQRSRLRVELSTGEEAALLLPRGSVLRGGDALKLSDGRVALVEAEPELVSTVRADDVRRLLRAAYHLGNRHVALEVGADFVRYLHDHVLDAMVCELGLMVTVEHAPFEPEAGAYGRHTHASPSPHVRVSVHDHAYEHGHTHEHDHAYEHGHTHEHDAAAGHVHVKEGGRGRG